MLSSPLLTSPLFSQSYSLSDGEISFAARQKIEQQLRRKEDDARALAGHLATLQTARDALLKEVTFLSSRNAQLEEEAASLPALREEALSYRKRNELLLVLLGEKEEELEALEGDIKEVKDLYRSQIEDLLDRVAGVMTK
jgi:chromosome segregation ATPase